MADISWSKIRFGFGKAIGLSLLAVVPTGALAAPLA